jgi:hypothetical protein
VTTFFNKNLTGTGGKMTKKAIGFMVVFMALVMAVPVSAQGPAGGKNGQSPGTLTKAEIDHITYMREEEKLARDVYLTLYESYPVPIFDNISASEQRHMDALEGLIIKYGLVDPVKSDKVGTFPNSGFTDLYDALVAIGIQSYCDALQVGIYIEKLDIEDIDFALSDPEVVAKDVIRVFENLLAGSENHLYAFESQLAAEEEECLSIEFP